MAFTDGYGMEGDFVYLCATVNDLDVTLEPSIVQFSAGGCDFATECFAEFDSSVDNTLVVRFEATDIHHHHIMNFQTTLDGSRSFVADEFCTESVISPGIYLYWAIEKDLDEVPRGMPRRIVACREARESGTVTTVSGKETRVYLEVHPVRPLPPNRSRPRRLRGVHGWSLGTDPVRISPSSPINIIPNPSVVPILPLWEDASDQTCARIECTFYAPSYMNYTAKDSRLLWTQQPLTGGQLRFFDPPHGLHVYVHGRSSGQVLLQVHNASTHEVLAKYRVLVAPLIRVRTRVNILNGCSPGEGYRPRSNSVDIRNHLKIANCFLRQIGFYLATDPNDLLANNFLGDGVRAAKSKAPGIFEVTVLDCLTRNVTDKNEDYRIHARDDALNIAYIKSFPSIMTIRAPGSSIGMSHKKPPVLCACGCDLAAVKGHVLKCPCCKRGLSRLSGRIAVSNTAWEKRLEEGFEDALSPPTSHYPNRDTQTTHRLKLFVDKHSKDYCGILIADTKDPSAAQWQQRYGCTIAHEFGHCLGLDHRREKPPVPPIMWGRPKGDNIPWPLTENVMHWWARMRNQDFDIIQALAVQWSNVIEKYRF